MVLSLKAKQELEKDNPYQVGQSGLIGNPAATDAFDGGEVLLHGRYRFPLSGVVSGRQDGDPAGLPGPSTSAAGSGWTRRWSGMPRPTLELLLDRLTAKADGGHLDRCREHYQTWAHRQAALTDPDHEESLIGKLRSRLDNTEERIRPELLAQAVNRHAAPDAVFTTDTGMSTVWLSRFVEMTDRRALLGSFNLGSMANAMPQALGAQALDRNRQVIAFCGDGGLTMLLGDLITAVSHQLDVKLIVFDNGRLGMVKLEQEQGGLPEFGTVLNNPDLAAVARAIGLHGIRVTDPEQVDAAVRDALSHPGPVLLDVLTNPQEVSVPGKVKVGQAWGFAISKIRESVLSEGDS